LVPEVIVKKEINVRMLRHGLLTVAVVVEGEKSIFRLSFIV